MLSFVFLLGSHPKVMSQGMQHFRNFLLITMAFIIGISGNSWNIMGSVNLLLDNCLEVTSQYPWCTHSVGSIAKKLLGTELAPLESLDHVYFFPRSEDIANCLDS